MPTQTIRDLTAQIETILGFKIADGSPVDHWPWPLGAPTRKRVDRYHHFSDPEPIIRDKFTNYRPVLILVQYINNARIPIGLLNKPAYHVHHCECMRSC